MVKTHSGTSEEAKTALQNVGPDKRAEVLKALDFGGKSAADLPRIVNLRRAVHFGWAALNTLRQSDHHVPLKYLIFPLRLAESLLRFLHWTLARPKPALALGLLIFALFIAITALSPRWPIWPAGPILSTLPAGAVLLGYVGLRQLATKPSGKKTPPSGVLAILVLLSFGMSVFYFCKVKESSPKLTRQVAQQRLGPKQELFQPGGWPGPGLVPLQFSYTRERAEAISETSWDRQMKGDAIRAQTADNRFAVTYLVFGLVGFLLLARATGLEQLKIFGWASVFGGVLDLMENSILIKALCGGVGEFSLKVASWASAMKFALLWPLYLGAIPIVTFSVLKLVYAVKGGATTT